MSIPTPSLTLHWSSHRLVVLAFCLMLGPVVGVMAEDAPDPGRLEFFESRIRPVLVRRCAGCHFASAKTVRGGLRLDSRAGIRHGGTNGPVVVPGKPGESRLLSALRHEGPKMPPSGRLPEETIADFTRWIAEGAVDPREEGAEETAGRSTPAAVHWAFQPPVAGPLPQVRQTDRVANPIDLFLLEKMELAGVEPAPEADRRTLARRLSFGLLGLPPAEEMTARFAGDDSPEAWGRLVDRLLDSPEYGRRWGRVWLDVVRYADTAGETADFPAPHAWRYRDYVIDAFNSNKPFDQFLWEQVAGDILSQGAPPERFAELITATGFLAIARRFGFDAAQDHYLTIEDTIDTLGKSVLGLTIACARCHDHKYDPITSADYYGLYGIFDSTRYAFPGCEKEKRPRDMIPLLHPELRERTQAPARRELVEVEAELGTTEGARQSVAAGLTLLTEGRTHDLASGQIADGGNQAIGESPLELTVKAGELVLLKIDRLENYGADTTQVEFEVTGLADLQRNWNLAQDVVDDLHQGNPHADRLGNQHVWGFFDLRTGIELLGEPARGLGGNARLLAWRKGDNPAVFVNSDSETAAVWTRLPGKTVYVHPAIDGPVGIGWIAPVSGRIQIRGRITDGHPGGPDGVSWVVSHLAADVGESLKQSAGLARRRVALELRRAQLQAQLSEEGLAYGVSEGSGHDARLQRRGEPADLGEVIPRKFPDVLGGHRLPAGSTASGREELAEWLTDRSNPLTARVFVNRVWQQHFGRGLVATPNDFGTRGALPTHPDLLDWLAHRFMQSGWDVKELQRLIVNSAMYRVSCVDGVGSETATSWRVDPENRLRWRFERRRLSAEEVRDSLLAAAGGLDPSPGGAHPFPPVESWGFTQHGPFNAVYDTNRRSVYLMVQRIRRHPFLGLFDGADPNSSTPSRAVSTVATQALFFLNSPFLHAQAEGLARRLTREATGDIERIDRGCRLLFGRAATAGDQQAFKEFLDEHRGALPGVLEEEVQRTAWIAWCRVWLAGNEFLYVD